MKNNYSKLLTNFVCLAGISGMSLMTALPLKAQEVVIPHSNPSIKLKIVAQNPPLSNPDSYPNKGAKKPQPSSTKGSKDIVALIQSNSQLKTLTQALEAADLVKTLKGKGPFTIFAPTDAAFAELPQDAVAELFKPENKEVLVTVLTYHVLPSQVLSGDLKSEKIKSVEGTLINVEVGKNGVTVNGAKITQADIKARNGVVHIIDQVIVPPNLPR